MLVKRGHNKYFFEGREMVAHGAESEPSGPAAGAVDAGRAITAANATSARPTAMATVLRMPRQSAAWRPGKCWPDRLSPGPRAAPRIMGLRPRRAWKPRPASTTRRGAPILQPRPQRGQPGIPAGHDDVAGAPEARLNCSPEVGLFGGEPLLGTVYSILATMLQGHPMPSHGLSA